jgi:hypothetical protein
LASLRNASGYRRFTSCIADSAASSTLSILLPVITAEMRAACAAYSAPIYFTAQPSVRLGVNQLVYFKRLKSGLATDSGLVGRSFYPHKFRGSGGVFAFQPFVFSMQSLAFAAIHD